MSDDAPTPPPATANTGAIGPMGAMASEPDEGRVVPRKQVVSWAFWDWATQPFNSVILTFVFASLYLVSSNFLPAAIAALPADDPVKIRALADLSSQYGAWTAIAGLLIFYFAPVLGARAETSGGRKRWLIIFTAALALLQFVLFFVYADPQYFTFGAIVLALGSVVSEIAGVNYNAMLHQVSTPKTVGRVSGLGWGLGYIGGIVALIIVVVLNFSNWFGLDTSNGLAYRLIAVGAAVWTIAFSIPLVINVPESRIRTTGPQPGFFAGYVNLVGDMVALYRQSRPTFWFLFASAVYRDGLAGVFAFGGILAAVAFGFGPNEVIIFGIAANIVAGISTIIAGRIDDRVGARAVIIFSLVGLVLMALFVFLFAGLGPIVFWIGGLVLSAFVGPAQASSRALLTRVTPASMQGEVFGLYATTGRVASPLSPALWAAFIGWFGATIFGVLGIGIVLLVGLVLLLLVRTPKQAVDRELEPLAGWSRSALTALTVVLFLGVGAIVLLLTGASEVPGGGYVTAGMLLIAALAVIPGHRALSRIPTTGEQGRGIALASVILGYVALAGAAVSLWFTLF